MPVPNWKTLIVPPEIKDRLKKQKLHPSEAYWSVIDRLLKHNTTKRKKK